MPVLGFLRQGSLLFLFRCVEGFADTTHVWVYVKIDEAEGKYLLERKNRIWAVLGHVGTEARKTVALATDEDGVLLAMDLKSDKDLSLGDSDSFVDFILQYGARVAEKGSKEEKAVFQLQSMTSPI